MLLDLHIVSVAAGYNMYNHTFFYYYRFPGAAKHKFLFVYLLKRIGDQYKIRKEAVQFIMDLVSLNAGMLMSCKFEEDREVQTGFQEHVGSYFQENCNGELILNNFSNLKKKVIYKYI